MWFLKILKRSDKFISTCMLWKRISGSFLKKVYHLLIYYDSIFPIPRNFNKFLREKNSVRAWLRAESERCLIGPTRASCWSKVQVPQETLLYNQTTRKLLL